MPLVEFEVRRDDRDVAAMLLFHEFEEDVGLFGTEIQMAHLVNDEDIDARRSVDALHGDRSRYVFVEKPVASAAKVRSISRSGVADSSTSFVSSGSNSGRSTYVKSAL